MKNFTRNSVFIIILLILAGSLFSVTAELMEASGEIPRLNHTPEEPQDVIPEETQDDNTPVETQTVEPQPVDTTPPQFPVSPVIPRTLNDLTKTYPIDLRSPANLRDSFEYNPATGRYELRSRIGGTDIITPIALTPEEYLEYTFQKSMNSYFNTRNQEELLAEEGEANKDVLSGFDFAFDLGPAEKLFGPGGVKVQAQGSALIKMGVINNKTANPTMTERQRNKTSFDFDSQVQMNVSASVGDKINFDINYNTEATFDFDSKKLKLGYVGKEDEIIKVLEAGNVSMKTSNSLIRGGAALFGIRTELQFGKLTVGAIFSQQESQSRTTKSKGNVQTTPFEIATDNFDENMHYFLSQYFFDTYDRSVSTLPLPRSGIRIERIEVWITNKRSNYDEARNIVAFADLAENEFIHNTTEVRPQGTASIPFNTTNDLYFRLNNEFVAARNKDQVTQTFNGTGFESGRDYEKIENARKLNTSEYTLNRELGYISLRTKLQSDEVLAVAYEYSYGSQMYQVGEFSNEQQKTTDNIYLKLIKGTNISPSGPTWKLMMRNVYTITTRSIESDKFRLDIKHQNDSTGVYLNYLTEGDIANIPLLRVSNLDRLDSRNEAFPDGFFDYVEGYTVLSSQGKIIFPVAEPFGKHLRKKINNNAIADKYVYEALYDSTLTVARQIAEKNKFILTGEYKGAGSSNIQLDGFNVARGSVAVFADGTRLTENTDYIVDYNTGSITITNPAYVNSTITTQSENQSNYGMQRKTMMGVNLDYAFSPTFNVGATIMNLSEMPLTLKNLPGEESINNTLFGFNTNYSTQSYWLTNLLDKIPFLELTAPSQITFSAEYAQLIPGHYKSEYGGNNSYIDDFEMAKMPIDLRTPINWQLSATPPRFYPSPRPTGNDIVQYGNNRALLAWYYIESIFTRKSSLTPSHIKDDLEQLSNHYVREVYEEELFPNKETRFNESSSIPVLNLAYYPRERGPYNLDVAGMGSDGYLMNPEDRWGGIFRRIESSQTDFESQNIETIEFWLLDPFIYDENASGGDLYINLGDVSEDILKDEKKFFENGLPTNGDMTKVEVTPWGYVPTVQSLNYAFDNTSSGTRRLQDVGLNGLSTEQEFEFETYANYIRDIRNKLDPSAISRMEGDQFSPLNDPSGDSYHHYRGSDYDAAQMPILGRYKRYNGTEGNSPDTDDTNESFSTASKLSPDIEDVNQDNTLNETESFFEYKISIRKDDLRVGENFIVDKRETAPLLKNGQRERVTWYQFKIPIKDIASYTKEGSINDFSSIRYMRMYLTNFADSTVLRFGTLELVRGDWRLYGQDLSNPNLQVTSDASVSISTVNLEENGNKEPVNYIMPPGVNRMIDPGQPQLRQQNEQSLSLRVTDLSAGDARAIYKNTGYDTRQYRRFQMFVHAEKLIDDVTDLQSDELSIFLRLGTDYKNNYYEYEIPLKLTPHGANQSTEVWPDENKFDFPFEILTDLKLARNKERKVEGSEVSLLTPYSDYDPNKPMNRITITGNPSLSDVKVIMVGIRNNSKTVKDVEVWINEMSLTDFNEDGGWAANVNLYVGLSDFGSINFSGRKETAGFGSIDQGIMDRNMEDYRLINFSAQADLGKFFPENKVNIPVYFSYNEEVYDPKYNPLDQDVLLKEALDAAETKHEKDSIRDFSQDKVTNKSLEINNVRVNVTSKTPMPYDPANFTIGYSFNERNLKNATTTYEKETNSRLLLSYNYSSPLKPWQPFNRQSSGQNRQSGSGGVATSGRSQTRGGQSGTNFFKDIGIGLLPKNITFNSDMYRNYFELQLRDLGGGGAENTLPANFREDFFWDRDFSIQWDLTKNLNFTLNTGTEARIDAPHVQVNKKLNMEDYEIWKDSVRQSIKGFGTPMNYDQRFTAKYNIPFRNIPILNFITAGLSYNADYSWERGATVVDEYTDDNGDLITETIETGNTIRNTRTWGIDNVNINLLGLYNKSKFLEEANKKYTMSTQTRQSGTGGRNAQQQEREEKARNEKLRKKFEGQVTLKLDSNVLVQHSLDNKRIRVSAKDPDGKRYEVKFKKKDANSIEIKTKDSVTLDLTITQLPPLSDEWWYKPAQVLARGLMMVRTVGFTYNETSGMMIPGFKNEIGDFFGQKSSAHGYSPGLDFAFGLTDESYLEKAADRGWLLKNDDDNNPILTSPAIYSFNQNFNFTSLIEPFAGLKINLRASYRTTEQNSYYYMYENPTQQLSGTLSMSTIALKTMFEKSNADNGYASKAFDKFRENRQAIVSRLENKYQGMPYPDAGGFPSGNFDPEQTPINPNSADVLIPAFLAAYTGKSASGASLDLFPALLTVLPNWTVTYEGLIQIPIFRKYFKSFIIDHAYKCDYNIGSYTSFSNWTESRDGAGFITNQVTNIPEPSSAYNITSVSITEGFDPLFKITSTFLNNMTLNVNYRVTRILNLNISSFQINERNETAWTFGAGYRFENFNKVLKLRDTGSANFNNELRVTADVSFSKNHNLIRKIEDGLTQATQGDSQMKISFTADYALSRMLTFQAYFDRQMSNPLVSSTAYPFTKTSFGISLKINFAR